MQLSPHFSLSELTTTATGLDNTPPEDVVEILKITANYMEVVRLLCGSKPIRVTSGWRSSAVNSKVGSQETSAHRSGWAVDFVIPGLTPTQVCTMLTRSNLAFDQIIDETRGTQRWTHISFHPKLRREHLSYINGRYVKHGGV